MKNTFLIISRNLLLVFAIGISTVGFAQSRAFNNQDLAFRSETLSEAMRRQDWKPEKNEKSVTIKNLSSGGLNITKTNQKSFDNSQYFSSTNELNKKAYRNLIVDLIELIEKSKGKPEAVQLQKNLKEEVGKTLEEQ